MEPVFILLMVIGVIVTQGLLEKTVTLTLMIAFQILVQMEPVLICSMELSFYSYNPTIQDNPSH